MSRELEKERAARKRGARRKLANKARKRFTGNTAPDGANTRASEQGALPAQNNDARVPLEKEPEFAGPKPEGRIELHVPGMASDDRVVRGNIGVSVSDLEDVDRKAKQLGLTRSRFFILAARAFGIEDLEKTPD